MSLEVLNTPKELELRPIHSDDNLSKLALGNADYIPLKIFLKKAALGFHPKNGSWVAGQQ